MIARRFVEIWLNCHSEHVSWVLESVSVLDLLRFFVGIVFEHQSHRHWRARTHKHMQNAYMLECAAPKYKHFNNNNSSSNNNREKKNNNCFLLPYLFSVALRSTEIVVVFGCCSFAAGVCHFQCDRIVYNAHEQYMDIMTQSQCTMHTHTYKWFTTELQQ